MNVYLVPVGGDRYELYCEIPDDPGDTSDTQHSGLFRRLAQRFRHMIAEAERERRHGPVDAAPQGWVGRLRTRTMRWVAESIAEQRLLWHLRGQTAACLYHPDDMDDAAATAVLRRGLRRDFEKHRFWLIIDTIGFILSGALALIPGPNLLAYYFAFRLVGHFFSLRGARQGLNAVAWRTEPSPPLTELRKVLSLDPGQREPRLRAVAEMLKLEHLARFFERTAVST